MTIHIETTLMVIRDCSFEVEPRELEIMAKRGVDVEDENAVAAFYKEHAGQEIDGWFFQDLARISDNWHTEEKPEIVDDEWYGYVLE